MNTELLERLKTEDFAVSVGFLVPPLALRARLQAAQEVQNAISALAQGNLTEDAIRAFVSTLMGDLHPGQRFAHDLAVAALAVVLESSPTDFARATLQELADLQLAEMTTSIRVARECLKHQPSLMRHHRAAV